MVGGVTRPRPLNVGRDVATESARQSFTENERLPNFLIVGAMKSGTTALAAYLRAHPEVFMSRPKEIHFFDFNYAKGLDWYKQHFADSHGARAIGEATVSYMADHEIVDRLARCVPHARLVAILRNPVDRAYSHYWFNRARGWEHLEFSKAIEAEASRIERADLQTRLRYSYVGRSRYYPQISYLCNRYPRQSLHVELFEDLRDRPHETFRRVCDFLSVNSEVIPDNLGNRIRPFTEYRSYRLRQMTKRYPLWLRRVVGRLNVRRRSYPVLDPSLRQDLSTLFDSDNADLEAWLGRGLGVWRTDA